MTGPDARFMRVALRLARKGGPRVLPNPRVGCVIVNGGRIVGRGYHAVFGGPHAEVSALGQAGASAKGATAYITLEPCCHVDKKTPPCAPALLRAGIARVVVGTTDPNPSVSGRGLAQLRRAGLRVRSGLLERECRELIRGFAGNVRRPRPQVILKVAASLDGKIATRTGDSKWITSVAARRLGHRLRAESDAVLVGIGTVLADDPRLTSHGAGRNPLRVVLDSRLRTPKGAAVTDDAAPSLIFTRKASVARLGRAIVVPLPSLRPSRILRRLAGMGVGKVLIEGGARVATSFLEAGLVDELRLFLAPKLIGGAKAPSFYGGIGARLLRNADGVEALSVRRIGADLCLRGFFKRTPSPRRRLRR